MLKILIADDQVIFRKGMKQILTEDPNMVVAGEAGTAQEALEKIKSRHWDVIVLDTSLPDRSVMEVVKKIKSNYPKLPVLVFTLDGEEQYALRALRAGASGYLSKDTPPEQLIHAINKVAQGGRYISPVLAEKLAFGLSEDAEKPPHELLSDREFQVMSLLASGKTVTEIAEKLYLSVKTVSTHRSRILEKMKMRNNAELIIYSIQNGLVTGMARKEIPEGKAAAASSAAAESSPNGEKPAKRRAEKARKGVPSKRKTARKK